MNQATVNVIITIARIYINNNNLLWISSGYNMYIFLSKIIFFLFVSLSNIFDKHRFYVTG